MSRNIPRRGLLLAAATSVLVPAAAHAATPLTPSADLYVSARAPRHNYGASKHLVVQRAPAPPASAPRPAPRRRPPAAGRGRRGRAGRAGGRPAPPSPPGAPAQARAGAA